MSTGKKKLGRAGKIFFYTLCVAFGTFGSFMLYNNVMIVRNGVEAEGTVVGYESRRQHSPTRGTSGYTDAPIVEFNYNGQTLRISSQISSAWHGYKVGDKVKLYFDPNDKKEILLDSFYHKYGLPTAYLLLTVITFFIPFYI